MRLELWNRVTVHVLGREKMGEDGRWLSHVIDPAAPEGPALDRLMGLAKDKLSPVRRIYSPKPAFTSRIACPGEFGKHDCRLVQGIAYLNGLSADGVILLSAGDAYRIAPADCHTFVMYDEVSGLVIAAHTGRDNLLDRQAVATGRPSPKKFFESIVDDALSQLKMFASACKHKHDPKRIRVQILAGIGPGMLDHPFEHPTHGDFNRKLVEHLSSRYGKGVFTGNPEKGYLDVAEVIRVQFLQAGVTAVEKDTICTFSDKDPGTGEYLWWSNKRGDKERNLVLVVRNK